MGYEFSVRGTYFCFFIFFRELESLNDILYYLLAWAIFWTMQLTKVHTARHRNHSHEALEASEQARPGAADRGPGCVAEGGEEEDTSEER